ncbi:MAG: AAA family ATPase [Runella sp.]
MITRLKVQGFKNLYDVEVYFGSFTCIAGSNGVGKSNLFDALKFLGKLTNQTLLEAALSIRDIEHDKRSKSLDIRNIFFHDGHRYCDTISFEVDLILPKTAIDDLGQTANATTTYVSYFLTIKYNNANKNSLEITQERLIPLTQGFYEKTLKKIGAKKEWLESIRGGKRQNSTPFIETKEQQVLISQDQIQGGRKKSLIISTLPRTVLSTANALEMPTALVCRREMESWRFLQLEPSALRSADDISDANQRILSNGLHLPATLHRLINQDEQISFQIANRLSQLIDDIFEITVDKDEKRDTLTIMLRNRDGNFLPASSLSDGTLRFLALSILEADHTEQGLICLEEPENGIHPQRIPAILSLLQDIATNIEQPIENDNYLRQVIINTHSPLVVSEMIESDVLFATTQTYISENHRFKGVVFKPLLNTWRFKSDLPSLGAVSKAELLHYLNPINSEENDDLTYQYSSTKKSQNNTFL